MKQDKNITLRCQGNKALDSSEGSEEGWKPCARDEKHHCGLWIIRVSWWSSENIRTENTEADSAVFFTLKSMTMYKNNTHLEVFIFLSASGMIRRPITGARQEKEEIRAKYYLRTLPSLPQHFCFQNSRVLMWQSPGSTGWSHSQPPGSHRSVPTGPWGPPHTSLPARPAQPWGQAAATSSRQTQDLRFAVAPQENTQRSLCKFS